VKTAIFCTCGSNNWETVEDRWVDAARQFVSSLSAIAEFLVSPYGSPIFLVLSASNIFTKFRRRHPLRGDRYTKYRWRIIISRFLPISRCISQTIQDSAIVTMEDE